MIYFDMDGVLAKYYTLEEIGDPSKINEKGYFRNLPPIERGVELLKTVAEYVDVGICSAVLSEKLNPYAREEKLAWLEEHIGRDYITSIIFTPCVGEKAKFVPTFSKADVLVDDQLDNVSDWKAKGGKAFLFSADKVIPDISNANRLHAGMSVEQMVAILKMFA